RISVAQSDFNFEISNAKCNKKDLAKEVSITPNHDLKNESCVDSIQFDLKEVENNILMLLIKTYYDKVKSFFNISCEIIDRLEQQEPSGLELSITEQSQKQSKKVI
ncbi:1254_t:CDS:2, partial [Racocetra persica]